MLDKRAKIMLVGLFFSCLSIQVLVLAAFHVGDYFFLRDDDDPQNYFINNAEKFDDPKYKLRRDLVINKTLGKTFDPETATVGSIREQFYYILALLETTHQERQNLTRANLMIRSAFQEYYYRAKSFGFRQWNALRKEPWSEDIDDYDSNYVNFVSPYLAYIGIEHWDKLEPATIDVIKKCYPTVMGVFYAIHNRVSYTNMFLLRCAGQLMLGVMYDDITMINMAQYEFRLYVDMITVNGYPEYNSPNYVYIDIWALQCIYSYAPDAEYRWYARAVLEWFYLQYVQNYHPSTGYMAGTSDRMKDGDYWWGRGSHSNIFYQYFGDDSERDEFGSSGTRLLTNYRYYPSDYIGEVAINKTFPLTIEAINYGIESYTYLMENYTLGTRSGAFAPENAGGTDSDLSGEAMEMFITYNASYPCEDEDFMRRSAWFDTSPHYNVWNSLQVRGTAITTVNFDIEEKRVDDDYSLFGKIAEEKAVNEIRINNTVWDENPVAFNHKTSVTIDINGTYIALRPTPSRTMDISGSVSGLSPERPCVLQYEEESEDERTWAELNIRNYVYLSDDDEKLPDRDIFAGFCVELSSKEESGSFSIFSELANNSIVTSEFDNPSGIHSINYTSQISNVSLFLVEDVRSNRLIERKVNGTEYCLKYLLKSKYTKVPIGATIEDLHGILIEDAFDDADSDGMIDVWESTFNLDVNADDSSEDKDSDGLTNIQEYEFHTNPVVNDTDGDGLLDDEIISSSGQLSPVRADTDSDSVTDGAELLTWGADPVFPALYILIISVAIWMGGAVLSYKIATVQSSKSEPDEESSRGLVAQLKTRLQNVDARRGILLAGVFLGGSHMLELFVPPLGKQILLYYSCLLYIRLIGIVLMFYFMRKYYVSAIMPKIRKANRKSIVILYDVSIAPLVLIIVIDVAILLMFAFQKLWWLYQTFIFWELIFLGLIYMVFAIILMRIVHLLEEPSQSSRRAIISFSSALLLFIAGAAFTVVNLLSTTRNDFHFWEFLLPHGVVPAIFIIQSILIFIRKKNRNKSR